MSEFVQSAQRELARLDQDIDRLEKEAEQNRPRRVLLRALLALYPVGPSRVLPIRRPPARVRTTGTLPQPPVGVGARTLLVSLTAGRKAARQPPPRQKVTGEEVIETLRTLAADHPNGVGPQKVIDKLQKPAEYIDYPQLQVLMTNLARSNKIRKLRAGRYLPPVEDQRVRMVGDSP
jgi:hypothetical protein